MHHTALVIKGTADNQLGACEQYIVLHSCRATPRCSAASARSCSRSRRASRAHMRCLTGGPSTAARRFLTCCRRTPPPHTRRSSSCCARPRAPPPAPQVGRFLMDPVNVLAIGLVELLLSCDLSIDLLVNPLLCCCTSKSGCTCACVLYSLRRRSRLPAIVKGSLGEAP